MGDQRSVIRIATWLTVCCKNSFWLGQGFDWHCLQSITVACKLFRSCLIDVVKYSPLNCVYLSNKCSNLIRYIYIYIYHYYGPKKPWIVNSYRILGEGLKRFTIKTSNNGKITSASASLELVRSAIALVLSDTKRVFYALTYYYIYIYI